MLDPTSYSCLGELLGDALLQFKSDTALVEMNRKREASQHTYLGLKRLGDKVAARLDALGVDAGARVAILMSNQPTWLISAYGALHRGAVLVPLDYKLQAPEQAALMAHCEPKVLVTEYPLWRKLAALDAPIQAEHVLVTEAPEEAELHGALRWEDLPEGGALSPTPRQPEDIATIVYSSGTGGQAKGCMLSHRAYLAQARILMDLYPMQRGDRYFSILPTNHAIDFMCGFIIPLCSGAMVVHQRTLRPEFILETMRRMQVTHMALVPLVLTAFERAIRQKLEALPRAKRQLVEALANVNQTLTTKRPNAAVSRLLLKPIHDAFGGKLQFLFCGGAFVDRKRAEFFYRLGIPVVIGYGLTEASTVATVNDLKPFRADSVGRAVPGVEVRIDAPNSVGVGQVLIKGDTLMSGYLDAPGLTAETLIDGWLHTGDLGHIDASGHLHLVGRSKNMIVTEGGKNVYPEDIEGAFEGLPCEERVVYSANYIWPPASSGRKARAEERSGLASEQLVAVVRCQVEVPIHGLMPRMRDLNRRLPDFKRVGGIVAWEEAFPRTASMKVKRMSLADDLRSRLDREAIRAL